MKKLFVCVPIVLFVALLACNNESKSNPETATENTTLNADSIEADSLQKAVMDGHDVGMAKMGKISRLQTQTQRLIDSIAKLPAKAKQAAAPYKVRLDSLIKDLDYAEFAMYKWMDEYKHDSAINNIEQRIKYLKDEKIKVNKMKETVLNAVEKADSLLKSKLIH